MNSFGEAESGKAKPVELPRANRDTHLVWHIEADRCRLVNVGYAEAGPANGPAVFCCTLAYDITACRCRAIARIRSYRLSFPMSVAYGTTALSLWRNVSERQPSAVAVDPLP